MAKRTCKYNDFINEPMGCKSIMRVPGIGPVTGRQLQSLGYEKAHQLYSVFLRKKRPANFLYWLIDETCARPYDACQCVHTFSHYAKSKKTC